MKAAIALLADHETQNFVRKIVFDLNRQYGIGFVASLLPAHVSLKQPFSFQSMESLDAYLQGLAESIDPFEIGLDRFYHCQWSGHGILGLNVSETGTLRDLHKRINTELNDLLEDASAPHDGDKYHFHLTVETGRVDGEDAYKRYYDEMRRKTVNLRFMARHIALFYYDGEPEVGSFMVYKVLCLGHSRHADA